jgi:hypothetical protein
MLLVPFCVVVTWIAFSAWPNAVTAALRYKVKDAREDAPGDGTRLRNKRDGYVIGLEFTGRTFDYHGRLLDAHDCATTWPWGFASTPNMCSFAESKALKVGGGYPRRVRNRCTGKDKRGMANRNSFGKLFNASPCHGKSGCPGNCCDGKSRRLQVSTECPPPIRLYGNYFTSDRSNHKLKPAGFRNIVRDDFGASVAPCR